VGFEPTVTASERAKRKHATARLPWPALDYIVRKKRNFGALVRQRTTSTERPPLVGEVSANFSGERLSDGQRNESPRPLFRFSRPKSLLSFQVVPQLSSRGWVDPVPDPLLLRRSGSAGKRTRDLWICSQKLWSLDHNDYTVSTEKTMDKLEWIWKYSVVA
jgi:hypothetical protein